MGMLRHWLRTNYRPGEPIRHLCDPSERNKINNILQDISGVGCRIEKPTDLNGMGWKIVIDGTSDIIPPDNYEFPGGAKVDDLSIDLNDDDEIQDFEWDSPSPVELGSLADEDLFMYRDASDASKQYIAFDDLVTEIAAELENQDYRTFLSLTDTPSTYPEPELDQVWVPVVNETGTGLEWADLDAFGVGRYWKLGGESTECYGNGIGNGAAMVIDLTNSLLVDSALKYSVDWENRVLSIHTLVPDVDVAVLDWANQELNEPWKVNDDTNATDAATGALTIAGGLGVAYDIWSGATVHADTGFIVDDDNGWTANDFSANVDGEARVQSVTQTTIMSTALLALVFGSLQINGNAWEEETVTVVVNGAEVERTILRKS